MEGCIFYESFCSVVSKWFRIKLGWRQQAKSNINIKNEWNGNLQKVDGNLHLPPPPSQCQDSPQYFSKKKKKLVFNPNSNYIYTHLTNQHLLILHQPPPLWFQNPPLKFLKSFQKLIFNLNISYTNTHLIIQHKLIPFYLHPLGFETPNVGHVWTKTHTTNIRSDLDLVFWSSTCGGHLECQNPYCNNLHHAYCTSSVNDIEFDSFTKEPFPIGGLMFSFSTLICKICKEPPKYIAPCVVKIFYVYGNDITQWVCILLGNFNPFTKKLFWKPARTLWISSSFTMIVILTICFHWKNLSMFLNAEKNSNCSHLRNKVTTFKYLHRLGVMDRIAKLIGVNSLAYI